MGNKMLLVDDEKIVCTGLSRVLQNEGFDVEYALNGKDAVDMVEANGFRLAIIDFMLPDINGLEVCRRIKMLGKGIKMIIMSGYTGILDENKAAFESISPDIRFIYKPFDREELLGLIS